jgi:lysyl-tRNA synthetase class 2
MDLERLQFRAHIMQKIRFFFINGSHNVASESFKYTADKAYLELDTPALSPDLIPESCLEVFKTDYIAPFSGKQKHLYLVPSPEIYIKKIISQHKIDCFQLSKCYRNVESCGHLHSPEFTMLEYYTMNADYLDSISITEKLFESLLPKLISPVMHDTFSDLRPPFIRMTIDEAFAKYAGGPISDWFSKSSPVFNAATQARKLGITESKKDPFENWTLEAIYNAIFVQCVEPALPKNHPIILMDYPSFVSCLAKNKKQATNNSTLYQCTERWELYCKGIELANCYSEETDPKKIQSYFKTEALLKSKSIITHEIDDNYYKIFDNFPKCSGVALGVDRLIALLANCKSIDSILPFPLFIPN